MTTERIAIESRRKIVVGLIALLAALALFAATAQEANATKGGTCGKYGDNLTWELRDGVLTISGEGEMADYEFNSSSWSYNQPWWEEDFTKVVVNEGVTSLGNSAFQWHKQLEEAVLPESLKSIGASAFDACGGYTQPNGPWGSLTVNLPSGLEHIGESAFAYSGIKQIAIPKGVKNLERAFDRSNIETVDLGEVENIGGYTFYYCDGLKQVNLPKTLKAIGSEAFAGTSLTEVIIPEGVTRIGEQYGGESMSAFNQCSELKKVVLPSTLTFISDREFGGCENLQEICYRGTEAQWKQLTAGIDPTSPLGEILKDSKIKVVYDYDTNIHINGDPDTPAIQANPMTVTGKTVKVKRKKLKKKAQTISADRAFTVNNAQGMVTYQKVSVGSKKVNKKYGKKIKINSSTGKITVKKGLKKGTYKVKVNVSAAGNANYYPLTRTTVVKIKIK
ncbi:MAG: leucine-rich repeat domain-containing protein [Firmicutes bacterium]|nr:leucine-rich repeat domain-containing protein [Bacillota bacterium]